MLRTIEVVAILDIPRERLQSWLNGGFIKPSVSDVGRGSKTLWHRDDVVAVKIFSELLADGVNRNLGGKVIRELAKMNDPVEFLGFAPPNGPVFAIAPNQNLELNAIEGGAFDHLHILNVSRLAAGVDARIREYIRVNADMAKILTELGVPPDEGEEKED